MVRATISIAWVSNLAQIAVGIVTVVGGVAAAIYFWKRREYAPRVQFDLGMRVIGERENELLIELTAVIRNVGYVRHRIKSFTFSIRGLRTKDPWQQNKKKNRMIFFPHKIVTHRSWIPSSWETFVEPGVTQVYPYTVRVSSDYAYLLLYADMYYHQSKDDHVAIITKSVAELRSAYLDATKKALQG